MAKNKTAERAPDFTLANLEGETSTLSDFRGQPVLLIFLRHLG